MEGFGIRSKVLYTFVMLFSLGITAITLALYPLKGTNLGTVLLALGVTLLTSGITSLFFEISARKDLTRDVISGVTRALSPLPPRIVSGENRNQLDFKEIVRTSGRYLDLMGLTLPDITEQGLLPKFEAAIHENGTRFRILLLDPTCDAAAIRSKYRQYRYAETFQQASCSTLQRLRRFGTLIAEQGVSEEMFDVRLYKELPLCLTLTNRLLILSVYTIDVIGQNAPYITFHDAALQDQFAVVLSQHFDAVWSESKSVLQMKDNEFEAYLLRVDKG